MGAGEKQGNGGARSGLSGGEAWGAGPGPPHACHRGVADPSRPTLLLGKVRRAPQSQTRR